MRISAERKYPHVNISQAHEGECYPRAISLLSKGNDHTNQNTREKTKSTGEKTHFAEDDEWRLGIEMLHTRRPIRRWRAVAVRIDGEVERPRGVRCIIREPLVLVHGIVEQAMDLVHVWTHKRGDAGGGDAPEALQRRGQPK